MSDVIPSPDNRGLPRLGSYQIVRQLGSGGMSNVFEAKHDDSGSVVALKVLPRKLAQNAVLLQRFLREAKSAENLDHPHIVAIYDRGFDQGRHYLVLEFVEGRDLYDRVRLNGPLKTPEAIAFIREVAQGLQYASKQGMIHRDVKPANLLMTPDGHAKIIDLGLALQADDEDERVTRDGTTVGTVDYMSPEQARDSRKINERSDIYSLGCTLHYLMTGFPPYPGGTLADKLARHHSAAAPDVRSRVPEIPADFSLLIQKMMAKKPDQRFLDYQELIEALDRIGTVSPAPAVRALDDVLIDESDDDDDDVLELTLAAPKPASPPPRGKGPDRPRPAEQGGVAEISLADLAAIDADTPSSSSKRRGLKGPTSPVNHAPLPLDLLAEEAVETASHTLRRSSGELPIQTWIAAGIMVGLLIAIVGFGVRFALSMIRPAEPESSVIAGRVEEESPAESRGSSQAAEEGGTYPAPSKAVPPRPFVRKPFELVGPVPPTIESSQRPARSLVETSYPADLLGRLGFSVEARPVPVENSNKVVVRRLVETPDENQTNSLANAFGRANDQVEIADTGPFHEDDFQIAGKSRLIRGRAGIRPIVKIESTRQALVRDQEAKFLVGMSGIEQLTIEGVDLVVDVRDLPLSQTTLFLCQGAALTLRDCTITVANAEDRRSGFSIFRLANGPRPNRLQIERTLIRGPVQTLVEVVSAKAEVSLDRTVVVGSNGPLIRIDPAERATRTLRCFRSLLMSRGPLLACEGKTAGTTMRALGTTFAHVDASPSPWLSTRVPPPPDLKGVLDYDGEANRWVGWTSLVQPGTNGSKASTTLAGLHESWPGADRVSGESPGSWPASLLAESTTAATFANLIPDESATLITVASPHPYLLELSVDFLERLPTPELLENFSSPVTVDPARPTVPLSFDAQPGSRTDFGLFLKDKVVDPSKHYLVQVQGTGTLPMSPVRLPDGVSVAIIGPGGSGTSPIPVFVAVQPGEAMIELHRGDLSLANLGFALDGAVRTRHWLLIEDSLLALRRCRYRDPGTNEASTGAAIAFLARSTAPLAPRSGGFRATSTRPIAALADCWIWTGSEAIAAEIGRGVVQLENCLIIAGTAAFHLTPVDGRPAGLEADLVLGRCTVVDDRFGVWLDAKPAEVTGTSRPWLVATRASVFPRIWRDGGALLGVDPATLAQGPIFWQSSNDLYEVNRFLGPVLAASNGPVPAVDLKRQWVDLWGINHTRGDRGPDSRKLERVVHFREKDRSRSTRPTPPQLELDPKSHTDQGVNFKSLPPFSRS